MEMHFLNLGQHVCPQLLLLNTPLRTWCKLKNDERRIVTWERKILRRTYDLKVKNGEWKIRIV